MNGSLPLLKGTGAASELREPAITLSREAFERDGHSSAASTCTSLVRYALTSALRELTWELSARTRSSCTSEPRDTACAFLAVSSVA